jgi:hypothetical protein
MAEKSSPETRQTDGKNLVWFGEIERKKLAELSIPTFTYRSSSELFYAFCLRWVTSSVKLDRPRSGFSLVKIPREGRAAENRGARTVAKRGSDGRAAKHGGKSEIQNGGKSEIQNGGGKPSSKKSDISKNRS